MRRGGENHSAAPKLESAQAAAQLQEDTVWRELQVLQGCSMQDAVVFHCKVSSNGSAAPRFVYCSESSLEVIGVPNTDLLQDFQLFTSMIDEGYLQDWQDRFARIILTGDELEWTAKLKSSAPLPYGPWVAIHITPRYGGADGSDSEDSIVDCFGFVYSCGEEQNLQKLKAEQYMYAADNTLMHFAQETFANIKCQLGVSQETVQTSGDSERCQNLRRLIANIQAGSTRGEADRELRAALNEISDGTYHPQETNLSCMDFVVIFAQKFGLQATLPPRECAGLGIKLDPVLMSTVLNNLVSNALKYGGTDVKPQLSVSWAQHYTTVFVKLWNAPGDNHQEFMRASECGLPTGSDQEPSTQRFSLGIGIQTIQKCMAATSWALSHVVDHKGTTFQVAMPRAALVGYSLRGQPSIARLQVCDSNPPLPETLPPAASAETVRVPSSKPAVAKSATGASFPSTVKIAVLDDSAMLRAMYAAGLRKTRVKQFYVMGASLDEISRFPDFVMQEQVDMVILDQDLSEVVPSAGKLDVHGTVVMRELVSRGFRGICITRTADDSEKMRSTYLESGFDFVLSKREAFHTQLPRVWRACGHLLELRRLLAVQPVTMEIKPDGRHVIQAVPNTKTVSNWFANAGKTSENLWEEAFWSETPKLKT
ncbi:hypothetical protein CYMTET_8839 [Cymbomonas tetramitiformis]|uniref:Response regulatory domain-containing protein n=1 Tax=Cymbomonas tetramitiformis TaxID=36881 RepID=A0AAE0GSX9_9CHLO|nr:hypothetical protein CYMTET_8839 [Cymbomonas tetramitiformis]|eukprot:gene17593-20948_t